MNHLSLNIQQTGSAILVVVFGLAIMGYGVLSVLKPEWIWVLEHLGRRWMYRDMEPTENALVWIRVIGAAAIVGGIFFILIMLKLTQGESGLL